MNIYWEEHEMEKAVIRTASNPDYSGGYDITGSGGKKNSIIFMMVKKPNWFHRFCTKLFLGWVWVDKKD